MRARLLTVLAAVSLLGGCMEAGCENKLVQSLEAPGAARRAVLFSRTCGATTGATSQVSILRSGHVLKGKGNAFVADTDHGEAGATAWNGPWVALRWLSPTRLLVSYDSRARTFSENPRVDGVDIEYELAAPP